ncbi:thiaminase II [Cytobacillus purgationiresistens]|uniref:Aminopyrimidine aminohydrolase n=1 Tax=Cytobacillus purgationiresistens TaxID=863449 RepID=A0ABU0ADM0_9BACI|nr:thiaminase II [Cytobacillus purgationiresistens]MDQ0269338.1 thiaminase/transcriptional activator TenA [Cytobacillus purgationiresistens]
MSFSQELRQEANYIFEACYNHLFVKGIAEGKLGKEQLIHYVKQDFEYLNAIVQTYALGISKATNREEMAMFNTSISFVLNSELHPHNNFCQIADVKYEDLQGHHLAPAAQHYTRHMLNVGRSGSVEEIIAVTLPCPYIYAYIGDRIMEDYKPNRSHPFYDWISFYGGKEHERLNFSLKRFDQLAEQAPEKERNKMKEHFMLSCQLEYMFFDMAYKLEDWPVQKEASAVAE